jgi:hypothetical protein
MKRLLVCWLGVAAIFSLRAEPLDSLAHNFGQPPAEARPWVYWFWNNANVTSNGITADLEAMQRVGIGGVLIMDVFERFAPPRGTAEFMNAEWQRLFEFSVQEAAWLGLEINMANGPGWCGSSGPWITPELSMQKLVWTNLVVTGPTNFTDEFPLPNFGNRNRDHFDSQVQFKDYYADIALLAFPATTNGVIPAGAVLNLSAKLGADGKLSWSVPAGEWVLQRIGHTTTGSSTRPPVAGGNGLECDKLSRAAMDAHFAGMMAKLIKTAGPLAGKSLTATHIDSWEVGTQNWTPLFRQEFQRRRGYDPLLWLPCLTDSARAKVNGKAATTYAHQIGDAAASARFRWDFNQTVSELLAENYSGRIEELARQHGLRYSLEGYNLPFGDEFTYTARADEPMTEFWTATKFGQNETWRKAEEMASVAHVYGHAICGAESFTSGDGEKWKLTPADIKSLGDFEFSQGVNRFVVHRYAHQPYLDRAPGATMGPWGLHYERTQTWWEMSGGWHEYLSRCQYLLRQGKFVADLLYLRPESPNQTYFNPNPVPPAGYRFDEISAEALTQRVSVKNGKLVLPDGMSYRVLVLPPAKTMTPALLEKIRGLTRAGATVLATSLSPQVSPSLQNFPKCDQAVTAVGREIWGDCDGQAVTAHALGKGKLIFGQPLETLLAGMNVPVDFSANEKLNWIHRQVDGGEIYFVANPANAAIETRCTFRVKGLRPELWNPETGATSWLAAYEETAAGITVPLRFEPSESAFIVFRQRAGNFDPVVKLLRNGQPLIEPPPKPAELQIVQATYGVPGDAKRTRDVRAQVQAMVNDGKITFKVAELAQAGDPAYGTVKTFSVEYVAAGKTLKASGQDPDTVALGVTMSAAERPAEMICDAAGQLHLVARESGSYEWVTASGRTSHAEISTVTPPLEIAGPWQVNFPPKWGAPESVTLTNLISWSDSADAGVKYFSGTATYRTTFDFSDEKSPAANSKYFLALGEVQVMARVKLNGQDCGIAWKPPFRVDVTTALRAGKNSLEIQVANLWPNRLIGDAALPEQQRLTWSSWEPFTKDTPLLKSGLLGPVKILESNR